MCKLPGHIVKLMAYMSLRRHRDRDAAQAASAHPSSREATRSSTTPVGGSQSSIRGTSTYSTSHARNDSLSAPSRTLSESRGSRGTHEREQEGPQPRKRSTTSLTKDQGSVYAKEGEEKKQEGGSRPRKEENQYRYDEYRTDERRDILRGLQYSSLRDNAIIHRPPSAHPKDVQPTVAPSPSVLLPHDAQSREINDLIHERWAALEENKALKATLASLKQQYDEQSLNLSVARHERHAALAQRKEIDDVYKVLRQQCGDQTKKLTTVRQQRQAAIDQKQKAEEEYAELKQKYEAQTSEHTALSNRYQSLKATLEQRTSELQGVQRFLTTADTFSGSEVVNMLRKLNEEVQQTTTFMAEWAVDNFVLEVPPADAETAPSIEQTRTSETLGTRLMQLLSTKKPILLEMAFRAYLIYELYLVASPWSIGQEEQSHNLYVDAIYERIRETEGQAVSGNWRALTRAYTQPACITDPEVAHAFDTTIVSGFSDILVAAGCAIPKSDITSALWSQFSERIHHFVALAGQVNKIIGVGVISEDFEVLVIWPDLAFDERAMENAYDNGERVQGVEHEDTVLCATELGLMQRLRVGAGSVQKGKPSELIVIKPKVALVSVLDIVEG